MTTVLVLSRRGGDALIIRRAQLDLLTRSLERYWPGVDALPITEPAGEAFHQRVLREIRRGDRTVCFATDDSLLHAPVDEGLCAAALAVADVLCFSLRLGSNTKVCYPSGAGQSWPGSPWSWPAEDGDFGYPGSVDGTVFRRDDLIRMLDGQHLPNPTALEVILDRRCRELYAVERPLMACAERSCYVSVPVNRVSDQSGVRYGTVFPQPAGELARRYDAGERISLEETLRPAPPLDSCHVELEYRWTA